VHRQTKRPAVVVPRRQSRQRRSNLKSWSGYRTIKRQMRNRISQPLTKSFQM
jgi:hypothetical protein